MERKWRVLIVVCVAVFMLLLDITVVNVALPDIQKELHTSFTDLQWVVDAYALTLAATMLNAGSLGDLLGRKRVFLVAIALFTVASALCGAAQSPLWLILARGAQGIGGAGMFAVSLAIISQEFHGRERGTAFGIWGATVGMAVAIGPLVGGALTTYVGWRWIFFVNVPIGIACVAAGIRVLHESRDEEHGGFDVPGLVTLTGGLFALVLGAAARQRLGLVERPRRRSLRRRGRPARRRSRSIELRQRVADARLPALPGADLHRRADHRLRDLVRDVRAVPLPAALPRERARLLGGRGRASASCRSRSSRSSSRRSPGGCRRACPCASCSAAGSRSCGVALLLMHGHHPRLDWTTLLPGFIVGGIGIGLVNAPLASTSVSVVEPRRAGMASGINNTFRQVGIATGIAALGAIFQRPDHVVARASGVPPRLVHPLSQAIASGARPGCPATAVTSPTAQLAHSAFISGLNEILLVAAFVLFAGAVLAFVLVRQRDFVASGAGRRGGGLGRGGCSARAERAQAERELPRRDEQDHRGAGDDHERLSGDREGDGVRGANAARGRGSRHPHRPASRRPQERWAARPTQRRRRGTRARARTSPASRAR